MEIGVGPRAILGLGQLLALGSLSGLANVVGLPHAPAWAAWAAPMTAPAGLGAGALVGLGLIAWWVWRGALVAAVGLVVILAAGTQLYAWQWPAGLAANGATALPGAVLVAGIAGRWWAPSPHAAPAWELDAAAGIVAAAYPLAGLAKLLHSGLDWASPENLAVQIGSFAFVGDPALLELRLGAARLPWLCGVLGLGTFVVELGAVLFLYSRLRRWVALAVVGLHLGISLLMGLHHYDWLFTTLGLALARAPAAR